MKKLKTLLIVITTMVFASYCGDDPTVTKASADTQTADIELQSELSEVGNIVEFDTDGVTGKVADDDGDGTADGIDLGGSGESDLIYLRGALSAKPGQVTKSGDDIYGFYIAGSEDEEFSFSLTAGKLKIANSKGGELTFKTDESGEKLLGLADKTGEIITSGSALSNLELALYAKVADLAKACFVGTWHQVSIYDFDNYLYKRTKLIISADDKIELTHSIYDISNGDTIQNVEYEAGTIAVSGSRLKIITGKYGAGATAMAAKNNASTDPSPNTRTTLVLPAFCGPSRMSYKIYTSNKPLAPNALFTQSFDSFRKKEDGTIGSRIASNTKRIKFGEYGELVYTALEAEKVDSFAEFDQGAGSWVVSEPSYGSYAESSDYFLYHKNDNLLEHTDYCMANDFSECYSVDTSYDIEVFSEKTLAKSAETYFKTEPESPEFPF